MNDKINPFLKTLQEDCEEAALRAARIGAVGIVL
jgi:hypothetical protein